MGSRNNEGIKGERRLMHQAHQRHGLYLYAQRRQGEDTYTKKARAACLHMTGTSPPRTGVAFKV